MAAFFSPSMRTFDHFGFLSLSSIRSPCRPPRAALASQQGFLASPVGVRYLTLTISEGLTLQYSSLYLKIEHGLSASTTISTVGSSEAPRAEPGTAPRR